MTGLKYDSAGTAIDRKLGPMEAAFDRAERRLTRLFFWYFMTQGIANAAIILGMLKLLR